MPISLEISCIVKPDRFDQHDRIQFIGGLDANGTRWQLSEDDAISGIERGQWSFFVSKHGRRVDVVIAKSATGRKYLKTMADGVIPNNLLSLTTCPW